MAYRRDDGLGCLVLIGLIAAVFIFRWISDNPVQTVIIGVIVAGACFAFYKAHRAEKDQEESAAEQRRAQFLSALENIIHQHSAELLRKRDQTVFRGAYGEWKFDKWFAERDYFYENVVVYALPGSESVQDRLNFKSDHEMRSVCSDLIESILDQKESIQTRDLKIPVDPIEFERWCARSLEGQGWSARTTSGSGDQGADVIAEKNGRRVVLQCKLYSKAVGNKAVQEAHAAREFEGADLACVVTNADYTSSARALAARTRILLLHPHELLEFDEAENRFSHPDNGMDLEESGNSASDDLAESVETAFEIEGEKIREIEKTRPRFWEYVLMEELLKSRQNDLKAELAALPGVVRLRRPTRLQVHDYLDFMRNEFAQMATVASDLRQCLERDVFDALGSPGVPGNPVKMQKAVNSLAFHCHRIMEVERKLLGTIPPASFSTAHIMIKGVSSTTVNIFDDLVRQWSLAVEGIKGGKKDFDVHVVFALPEIERMSDELGKIMDDSDEEL